MLGHVLMLAAVGRRSALDGRHQNRYQSVTGSRRGGARCQRAPMDQSQGLEMRGVSRKTRIVLAAGVLILGCTAEARVFEQLPVGAQVNDDPASGIDHEFAVGQSEPANSDV